MNKNATVLAVTIGAATPGLGLLHNQTVSAVTMKQHCRQKLNYLHHSIRDQVYDQFVFSQVQFYYNSEQKPRQATVTPSSVEIAALFFTHLRFLCYRWKTEKK